MLSWKPKGGLSDGLASTRGVGTLAIVMFIEYTRHARDPDAVHLDTAGVAQVEYIRSKPTAVESRENKLVRITREEKGRRHTIPTCSLKPRGCLR